MRHVYTARDALDATFLRGLLEQEGIKAVVQGQPLEAAWGDLNLSKEALPSVWVDDADVAKAAPLVDEYRERDAANSDRPDGISAARSTWTCGNCGTRVEEQFTKCWRCGHDRRDAGPMLA
ncbi:MAG TPA: DUF2007 domain-containing protein [Humisphaera sp.]